MCFILFSVGAHVCYLKAKSKGDNKNARDPHKLKQWIHNNKKSFFFPYMEFYTQLSSCQPRKYHKDMSRIPGLKKHSPFTLSQKAPGISRTKQTQTAAVAPRKTSTCQKLDMVRLRKARNGPENVHTEFKYNHSCDGSLLEKLRREKQKKITPLSFIV